MQLYVPVIESVTKDFVELTRKCLDEDGVTPANYGHYIQRFSLEAMATIALDTRLNLMDPNQNKTGDELVEVMDRLFTISYQLDVMPSIWRYLKTPMLREMMKVVDRRTR